MRRRAAWHVGEVVEALPETPSARRLVLEVPTWPGNDAGQHLDIRLTAPDGYSASRSYSIGSSGDGTRVVLAVDELPRGEVSPFLVHDVQVGDRLEVHGPLGGYFVWRPGESPAPVQLIAGGSGVVPLFAIADAHRRVLDPAPLRLLYSVRSPASVFFARELDGLDVDWVYTREDPGGRPGRLTRERLLELTVPAAESPRVYVCGPTGFVETVAAWLVDAGHEPAAIRTERFGGS